jgi:hypothetical protein
MSVFFAKTLSQFTQPFVISFRLTYPLRRRMIQMSRSVRNNGVRVDRNVTSTQQLTGFQNHFDHVAIAVHLGTYPWDQMEEEDVHEEDQTLQDRFGLEGGSEGEGPTELILV